MSRSRSQRGSIISTRVRLLLCAGLGLCAGASLWLAGLGRYAPLAAWDVAAGAYLVSVLWAVLGFDQAATKSHALAENPGRATADALLLAASTASLVAVGLLMLQSHHLSGGGRVARSYLAL